MRMISEDNEIIELWEKASHKGTSRSARI